ncbi:hypothetical protein [Candidatus Magnetomonas plexicatena]|uniref:hypothetical protein n=1 Tax=Candidatus Magnetomonas plexicatena TaxID=2552947 RepID=UPI0011025A37|nr:glycosyltransferase family 4 protein [Nitrospirales bacterium LBB_01]
MPPKVAYPKILIISPCAFNHITGTGITFSNLFYGWPKENLAVATGDTVRVTKDVCSNYYFLTDAELPKMFPFNIVKKMISAKEGKVKDPEQKIVQPITDKRLLHTLSRKIFGSAGVPETGCLTSELTKWIEEFKPDVIYTITGSIGYPELVLKVHEKFKIPIVLHIMDDGVIAPNLTGVFSFYTMRKFNETIELIMRGASVRIAICREMAEEYEKRYGYPFNYFQSTVSDELLSLPHNDKVLTKETRVVYSGSIFSYAQLESLKNCCQCVIELAQEGYNISLNIYTALEIYKDISGELPKSAGVVRVFDALFGNQCMNVLRDAAILLLPVNFDKKSVNYIKLSMPTKVPFYLASGTPILVYGPTEVAQVKYAAHEGWGYVVSQRGVENIKKGLVELINNNELRQTLSKKAREIAAKNHSDSVVRTRFQELIKNCN